MNIKDLLLVAESVSNEKGVSPEVVIEAIELALATATKKLYTDEDIDCRVAIDRATGTHETFRVWTVVENEKAADGVKEGAEGEEKAGTAGTARAKGATAAQVTAGTSRSAGAGAGAMATVAKVAKVATGAKQASGGAGTGDGTGDISGDGTDEEPFQPDSQITLAQAMERDPSLKVGDTIEERIDNAQFGRIAAQAAKQVIFNKVREAERQRVLEEYQHRVGELVAGTVKRVTREIIIVDLGGNADAALPRSHAIPREIFRVGDRMRAILTGIDEEARGPQLQLSRTVPAMLIELFKIEVPEIAERVIEIKATAREPGFRSKIAVSTNDGRIDPVGSCVGMRGSRVQVVSNELANERIDIIPWDDNPAQLVINAMSPATVASVVMDEEAKVMDVAVEEENLAQAIGRNGQNVRLSSQLTGWTINVMSEAEAVDKQRQEVEGHAKLFMDKLAVDKDVAEALANEGFISLDEIAYVPVDELLAIDGFDEELTHELRNRAKDALLTMAIASEEDLSKSNVADDLLAMEGMDDRLALALSKKGILTMEDLAEQSIDELMDIDDMDEEFAGKLIMTAREPWFAEQEPETDSA